MLVRSAELPRTDPMVGRFLQPDSIVPEPANPQALNRYSYAYNNPLTYTDPTGHSPWDRLEANVTVCLLGISCASQAPNLTADNCLYFGCLPASGGICLGCLKQFGVELAMGLVHDVCSVATWNPSCGLLGGHSVSLKEWSLSLVGVGLLFLGPEASELDVGVGAAGLEVPQILANKALGDAAAEEIASRFPGALREVTIDTALGPRRVDVLTGNGLAIESKVGRTALTPNIAEQIAKDVALVNSPRNAIRSVLWAFSRSPVTGLVGPTGPLAAALEEAGIPWVVLP